MADTSIQTKEISPGVFLYKQQQNLGKPDELVYLFKVEVKKLNTIEFTADFTGSENIELDGSLTLVSVTTVEPFNASVVAKLILRNNWKLKSRFKYTIKPPSMEIQQKYIMNDSMKLKHELSKTDSVLRKYPYSIMSANDVAAYVTKEKVNFFDLEFPPIDNSVFGIEGLAHQDYAVHWRKPSEFMEINPGKNLKEPSVFYETIDPSDIKQGSLGDCWFLSALASLAERPALVERLFITKECNQAGVYRVKICKNGEWVAVTVDDYFPCYPMGGPIFSRAHGNELWVLLLEKAYAKLHGNYFLLKGGYANEAMIDLTGCPTSIYTFEDEETSELIKNGNLWKILRASDDLGFMISASTPGEDRWSETLPPDPNELEGLLPGHAYSVIQVKEARGYKILNIRNPWGRFEWKGDWSDNSAQWTKEMIDEVKPIFDGEDGSFWMSYGDFLSHFYRVNICKVRNWDEVRIKGKFIRVQDIDDTSIEVVLSKWYYSIELAERTRMVIGIHQEDERVCGVATKRSNLDIGVVILKRTPDGSVSLERMKELAFERQIELEVELEPGSYIILPRTTGCSLRRPADAREENIKLLRSTGQLHEQAESTIKDIFRKFDMLLNRELSFVEFKGFFECINKQLTEKEFKMNILDKYASTERGITCHGFLEFWKNSIRTLGEETVFSWLELLGYDRDLFSVRSRCFILTMHCENEISVTVRDAIQTDLDNRVNNLLIQKYGRDMESRDEAKSGVKIMYYMSKLVHGYSYGVLNEQSLPIEVTLNCSESREMLFSTKSPIIKKRVEPGQLEFLMHSLAVPSADEYTRNAKCTWQNLAE